MLQKALIIKTLDTSIDIVQSYERGNRLKPMQSLAIAKKTFGQ